MLVGIRAKVGLNSMGRKCPLGGHVVYLDCLECDDKICRRSDKMANTFIEARKGYKFTPTEKADGKVLAKFDEVLNPSIAKQYKHNVPSAWIKKGFIKEVKE